MNRTPRPQRPIAIDVLCDPGVLPGKWVSRWRDRFKRDRIRVLPLQGHEHGRVLDAEFELPQREVEGSEEPPDLNELQDPNRPQDPRQPDDSSQPLDPSEPESAPSAPPAPLPPARTRLALLRLPLTPAERELVHAIVLYQEEPQLVMPKDCDLGVLDEVELADFFEATRGDDAYPLLSLPQLLPAWNETHDEWFAAGCEPAAMRSETFADAVEAVAHGAGLLVLPLSVARQNDRKDVTYRPFRGLVGTEVAVVWRRDCEAWEVEEFVGIVRGRTANSSRSSESATAAQRPVRSKGGQRASGSRSRAAGGGPSKQRKHGKPGAGTSKRSTPRGGK